jgi:phenylpropionate dioxygenase-like ring-hydroxylating dioxygenase large terminal subunit
MSARIGRTWTEEYGMTFGPVSHRPNIDPTYFERERERIFKRSWINVCRIEEIGERGSFLVRDLEILETSVLLTHDKQGNFNAFHNVCKHRGNKLVMSGGKQSGRSQGLVCSFHAWTYDLEGNLTYLPDEEAFCNLDREAMALKRIAVDVWRGFVFICLQNPAPKSLQEYLGEWGNAVGEFPFDRYAPQFKWTVTANCNWKVFVDAFQETYHTNGLHRKSGYKTVASADNPFVHLLDAEIFPSTGHRRVSHPSNLEFEPAPTAIIASKYAPSANNLYVHKESRAPVKGTNRLGSKNWSFDINICFPNLELLLGDGWYLRYNYWPIAVDKTRFELHYYRTSPKNAADRVSLEGTEAMLRDVMLEDLSTVENLQSVLKSGAIESMQLSDMEVLLRFHYKFMDQLVQWAPA